MAIGVATNVSGYSAVGMGPATGIGGADLSGSENKDYWTLGELKRAYADYLASKRNEIVEQQVARRYRHGAQWTSDQIKVFNDRKQPIVTYNRLGRKIDGIVGLAESLRRDPKAFPRTPRFQAGADLATAALRSALEKAKWKLKASRCAETAAVDGIGGVELLLTQHTDPTNGQLYYDVDLEDVDTTGFFYDPRSKKDDFSDATYMGMGKWIDSEVLKAKMPDKAKEIADAVGAGRELTSTSDSDATWFMAAGQMKSVRLVYCCYQHQGGWCWALFTGSGILMQGKSYFVDCYGKPICSFIMFSAAVDHDNDRYGFPRNLMSPQDEVNQRRSKGLHELNTRRIVAEKGAFDNIEDARKEAVRPDGVVIRNKGFEAEFDDSKKQQDIAGQLKFLEDAKAEIENFGPNAALLGSQGITNRSGRAIALMQQQGLSELGPYIISHSNWKLRVYEGVFFAVKKYWTNERWIRVTDDDGIQQFVQINGMQNNQYGMPQLVNQIGEVDVDIAIDEGPDTVTMMQDMYETLAQIIPAIAPMLTPQEVQAVVQMLIETSPLPGVAKRKFQMAAQQSQQPNPMQQQMQAIQLQGAQAGVQELQSKAALNMAKAQEAQMPKPAAAAQPPKFELPPVIQINKAAADIRKTDADAYHKLALAYGEKAATNLQPLDYAQRAVEAMHTRQYDRADLAMRKYEADKAQRAPMGA